MARGDWQAAQQACRAERVLLTLSLAYKVKKPLRLPLLDLSTLALRRQFCAEKLRLNRRLALSI